MRLVYLGTPEIAVAPLRALHRAGHEIVLVVSGPDKRRGRGSGLAPSPVKAAAMEFGIPVTDEPDDLLDVDAELGVVVAYGRILRPHLLAVLPMVNLHFSLLPRWRGAAPVERAILAGDALTGVALMDIEHGLDTGGVHGVVEVPIGPDSTAEELREQLVGAGVELLVRSLDAGLGASSAQAAEGVTHAAKLSAADRELDWQQSAVQLHRVVRVGGAWTTVDGDRLKVLGSALVSADDALHLRTAQGAPGTVVTSAQDGPVVRCGDGALRLVRVQAAGRSPVDAVDWARGSRPDGLVLGE